MKAFEAVKKKVTEIIKSKDSTTDQKQKRNNSKKQKKEKVYIPPITIDDVTFSTTGVSSEKDVPKMEQKLLKIYNKEYMQECEQERLCVEIVGLKNFPKIIKSTQKYYNHKKDRNYFSDKFIEKLWQIYNYPNLMKHFWSIDFCKLKVMNLSNHGLESLDGLTFMELPNLVCLEIHTNNLMSIECLGKISFPKLQTLTLYNNQIRMTQKISRAKLPQLKNIQLDTQNDYIKSKIENINFVFKLQKHDLKKFYAQDKQRIFPKKCYRTLIRYCSIFHAENMNEQLVLGYSNIKLHINRRTWHRQPQLRADFGYVD